jgi:hypothetical protein
MRMCVCKGARVHARACVFVYIHAHVLPCAHSGMCHNQVDCVHVHVCACARVHTCLCSRVCTYDSAHMRDFLHARECVCARYCTSLFALVFSCVHERARGAVIRTCV